MIPGQSLSEEKELEVKTKLRKTIDDAVTAAADQIRVGENISFEAGTNPELKISVGATKLTKDMFAEGRSFDCGATSIGLGQVDVSQASTGIVEVRATESAAGSTITFENETTLSERHLALNFDTTSQVASGESAKNANNKKGKKKKKTLSIE